MGKSKADKAVNAMKALGIDRGTVKPVLKQLLKVYDKNWEFIEAENYRALVDAIFGFMDEKENERVKMKRAEPRDCGTSEPPQKKLHGNPEEDEAFSLIDSETLAVCKESDALSTPYSNGRLDFSNSRIVNKGKGQLSPTIFASSEQLKAARASSSSCPKILVNESSFFHKPLRGRASTVLPELVDDSSKGNVPVRSSQCVKRENTKQCASACNFHRSEHMFDIVSLPSRNVKLCCVFDSGNVTSHTPDMDAVLKLVEVEFLRSHKIVGPPFSLRTLMEDICKRSFELSTNQCTKQSLIRTSPKVRINDIEEEEKPVTETTVVPINDMNPQPQLYVHDISKGAEKKGISLVYEQSDLQLPQFFYIPRNIIYQKAIINISLARISDEDCCPGCSENCLSSPVPCACARVTNGEYAYTQDGLLTSEFLRACNSENKNVYCQDCPIERVKNKRNPAKCSGHAVKRFIKECWIKCGCSMQCGNRIVQQGITRSLQIFRTTEGKGWGLRTLEKLPQGAFVCEYVGEVVTNTELDERNKQRRGSEKHTYPVQLDADWGSESILDDDFALCLDATNYGNVARFINHKCGNANLIEIPVEVETADHHYYHLAFFTTEEVNAFEELTWDYGIDFNDDSHPIKAFQCQCGSKFCRGKTRKGTKSSASLRSNARLRSNESLRSSARLRSKTGGSISIAGSTNH